MRILWLNWRDIKNPASGGAEVFTHAVIRRLTLRGYQITLFTSSFLGALDEDWIDGARVVRAGGKYSVYREAERFYKLHANEFDLIVDEINTKPFLSPKYVEDGKPIIALIHQLAREGLFYELSFPLNYIAFYYLEKKWLSTYKDRTNVTFVTVSQSTKSDLESFVGFRDIHIVPEGLNFSPLSSLPNKETVPTIAFVGRLKRYKLPDHALEAFELVKRKLPSAKMWVVGDGYLRNELIESYGGPDVTFFGRIDDKFKHDLMSRAHIILVPSIKEGWGLVVTESNAMGTPAIAYDVSGLRDSVIDGQTGVLVKENSPEALANAAISLLENRDYMNNLALNALEFSRSFDWDKTASEFSHLIEAASARSLERKAQSISTA